jgi:hypothetical protein
LFEASEELELLDLEEEEENLGLFGSGSTSFPFKLFRTRKNPSLSLFYFTLIPYFTKLYCKSFAFIYAQSFSFCTMAEARNLSLLSTAFKTGVAMAIDSDGIHLRASLTIPPLSLCLRRFARKIKMLSRALYYLAFPLTSPLGVFITASIVASISAFLEAPSGLNSLNNNVIIGFTLTILIIFVFSYLSRITLWLLLKNHTFLRERARSTVPFHQKIWFLCVRALTRGQPLLFSFQSSLPRLPVPNLHDTVESFINARKILQTEDEERATKKLADAFLAEEGPSLQWRLYLKHFFSMNYISDWWEKYVYLRNREALPVSSNFYAMDSGRTVPTTVQSARAAFLTHLLLRYASNLEHETIAPVLIGSTGKGTGGVPLCMNQIKRLFSTSRNPGREIDNLKHWPQETIKHCAVYSRGSLYLVQVIDDKGTPCSPAELQVVFSEILADSLSRETAEMVKSASGDSRASSQFQCEALIPVLTALPRSQWAEIRETIFGDGINKKTLNALEKSLFYIILSPSKPDLLDWSLRANLLMTGDNEHPGVFFDKSFCLTVFANGQSGLNSEHSHSDAPITGHLLETILITEHSLQPYDENGEIKAAPVDQTMRSWLVRHKIVEGKGDSVGHWRRWVRTSWSITRELENATTIAKASLSAIASNLDLVVESFGGGRAQFGKGFIKKCGVSPDAFIQIAMQVAAYKEFKKPINTYESSMTRLFLHGRTETVRPCTVESQNFVSLLLDDRANPGAKLASLRIANERHVDGYVKAMCGEGIDRHLFGLYVVSVGLGIESTFLKEAVSAPWILSTSQVPQQQTLLWDAKDKKFSPVMSAGGGFGPACDGGYGVSYSIAGEDEIVFHVSASKKSGKSSAARFKDLILETLEEMKTVLAVALKDENDEVLKKNPPLLKVTNPPSSAASVIGSPSLLTPEPLLMSKK